MNVEQNLKFCLACARSFVVIVDRLKFIHSSVMMTRNPANGDDNDNSIGLRGQSWMLFVVQLRWKIRFLDEFASLIITTKWGSFGTRTKSSPIKFSIRQ